MNIAAESFSQAKFNRLLQEFIKNVYLVNDPPTVYLFPSSRSLTSLLSILNF
jgi:hypothetical protein